MLIVIAEKEELQLVEELGYSNFPVIITGVGGMNVIDALRDVSRDTEILNIGYCGSNCWEDGTVLSIYGVATYHENAFFNERAKALEVKVFEKHDDIAYCYTSTDFVTETNKVENCVFDMELAFIRAMFNDVRAIKVVSDNLNKNQYEEKIKNDRKSKSKASR